MALKGIVVSVLYLGLALSAWAEGAPRAIKVLGREKVTVTTSIIRLGDIAEISSPDSMNDETVIGLQKIYLDRSPAPGKEMTMSAASVLETLTTQGVDVNRVSYAFPRIMTIQRAGRALSSQEVRQAIERALEGSGVDVVLKDIRYPHAHLVSPGEAAIEAAASPATAPGLRTFTIKTKVNGEQQPSFDVSAYVEEWGMLPVAKRSVTRGSLIAPDDVVMARVNLAALPADTVRSDDEVIGLEVSRDITFGEVFRREKLSIPPLVTAGSRVTMLYKRGPFEASATGVALESGIKGQEIKIRNDASKKVVSGIVVEPGVIGVKP